jgi:hypothetical protein
MKKWKIAVPAFCAGFRLLSARHAAVPAPLVLCGGTGTPKNDIPRADRPGEVEGI